VNFLGDSSFNRQYKPDITSIDTVNNIVTGQDAPDTVFGGSKDEGPREIQYALKFTF